MTKRKFKIKGMHCKSCEKIIENILHKNKNIKSVKIDYVTETGEILYNSDKLSEDKILKLISQAGYEGSILDEESSDRKGLSTYLRGIIAIIGILVAGYFILGLTDKISLPQISQNMSYGLLFLVGILTGFHCIAMCGGFVVSYTTKDAQEGRTSYKSHLLYGLGKTVSYTLIGASFGFLGSIITFTPLMRGVAGIIAGLFLIIFGINMLGLFSSLRVIRFKMPSFVSKFVGVQSKEHNKSPLIIGLLNGLMIACGPLQAIYIMAAGTGSWLEGAKLLFVFALGTLPVMIGFGFFTSFISSKATQKILKISGALVIILGLIMLNTGLALNGQGYDARTLVTSISPKTTTSASSNNIAIQKNGYQEIRMDVISSGWSPNKFILKKGVPVKWIITGKELTSCNNAIQVPKLGLKFNIKKGEQIIEFTPTESGSIPWSCWMGMIQGTFIVKDNIDITKSVELNQELAKVNIPKARGCGCGG